MTDAEIGSSRQYEMNRMYLPRGRRCIRQSGKKIDDYVAGASTGVSAYYGVGGAVAANSIGSSMEFGIGTPGVAFQPVKYMHPIVGNLSGWGGE